MSSKEVSNFLHKEDLPMKMNRLFSMTVAASLALGLASCASTTAPYEAYVTVDINPRVAFDLMVSSTIKKNGQKTETQYSVFYSKSGYFRIPKIAIRIECLKEFTLTFTTVLSKRRDSNAAGFLHRNSLLSPFRLPPTGSYRLRGRNRES